MPCDDPRWQACHLRHAVDNGYRFWTLNANRCSSLARSTLTTAVVPARRSVVGAKFKIPLIPPATKSAATNRRLIRRDGENGQVGLKFR